MFCIFLWITLVMGIPNLMPMVARGIRPVPSEGKMAMEKQHKRKEVRDWAEKTLRSKIHDRSEFNATVERLVAIELDGINQFRRNRVHEQISLAQNLARISPSSCYIFAGYDLAKTGVGSFMSFHRYANWYRSLFNQAKDQISKSYREEAKEAGTWWGRLPFREKDYKLIPKFRPLDVPFTDSVRSATADIGLLFTFNLVFFLAAYAAFLRYDVK